MTVVRKCDSTKRGVKGIREMCRLTERCDSYEGGVLKEVWEGVTVARKCDNPKLSVGGEV